MASKVKVEVCEKRSGSSCVKHMERELESLPELQMEMDRLWKQLIPLYRAQPKEVWPLLAKHVISVIGCIDAQENLCGAFTRKKKRTACGQDYLAYSHELCRIFRKHKEEVCLYLFGEDPDTQRNALLSPRLAVQKYSQVKVIVVELENAAPQKQKTKKKRFELLLESGFMELSSIKPLPMMKKLKKVAKIVGCSVRHLQELGREMKLEDKDPFGGKDPTDPRNELFQDFDKN